MQSAPKDGTPGHGAFRAYQIRRDGPMTSGLARLTLADLSPGDVVIRTAYAGVNYKDALATTEHGNVIRKFPRVAGSDASGWIVASGDPRFREGDEVAVLGRGFGVDHDGGFSEYLRVPADWVIKLPGGFALRDAATLGIAGYTAALAVHLLQEARCQPEQGEILVNGATGAVSSMAIEMLARLQYRVAAVSSKAGQAAYLQALGAQTVLGATDLVDQGRPLEPARWAGGLDALGGKPLDLMLRSTMPRGCVASFGNVAGNELSTSVLPFILRGVRLIGVNLTYYLDLEAELWARLAGDLRPQHTLELVKTITLDELAQQLQCMLEGRSWGRTIVAFPA
ncbi:YhdH/YhfP family quinone oxidoreductase [Achromobacter pestifer]|uniref:YhdH/YhfP family quinone oxidoreductase n=1 Tax=Achromobacter pestifer TaxID=1353889 RepID=A0A7D4II33_9BURK|nr:YhdH/YhfP family quinone oxidoreductase [Achromobacter pestifer]QKH36223.1 YhdH/YhfP family quinone oxidoreductase [Achromobacter pestifer]